MRISPRDESQTHKHCRTIHFDLRAVSRFELSTRDAHLDRQNIFELNGRNYTEIEKDYTELFIVIDCSFVNCVDVAARIAMRR